MALSICCVTASPVRAAAALAPLRPIAEEIVVAVDVSGGERDLAALGALADRLFEIEIEAFVEQAIAWLHAQCSADWILRIDDDEVPSVALIEQLPELIRARDVLQYWPSRRWLYPDAGHWLDEWPWFPDFQGRLVRNDPLLWFPGICHSSLALAMPARYLDDGLYHLAHLTETREQRERKVERYLELDAALRAPAGDARVLSTYYVPEGRQRTRAGVVDPRDHCAIATMLAPAGDAHSSDVPAPHAQRVTREEVHAHWAERDLDEAAYRASIRPLDTHRQLLAGDPRPFRVCVRNEGTESWPGEESRRPLIRLAYRWLTPQGGVFQAEGIRTALPHPLAPGEACVVAMNVTPPSIAGRYVLAPDVVHEGVKWFQCDSPPLEMRVIAPDVPSL
jgi:hypothetical protein